MHLRDILRIFSLRNNDTMSIMALRRGIVLTGSVDEAHPLSPPFFAKDKQWQVGRELLVVFYFN